MKNNEKSWLANQQQYENKMLEDCKEAVYDIVSKLVPKIRAKALENGYKSDANLTIDLDLKAQPKISVSGFVPPIIEKCQKF